MLRVSTTHPGVVRCSLFVIFVRRDARACAVRHRDDAPAFVSVEEALVGQGRALIPRQRLIHAGAVNVAAFEQIRAVIFRDQVCPVIQEPRRHPAPRCFIKPQRRIIAQAYAVRARLQQVFGCVAIGACARARQVAARVIAQRRRPGRGDLVKAIGGVWPVDIIMPVPG
jgi:hypothetical protein